MNKIKYLVVVFFLVFASCSQEDGTCPCVRKRTQQPFVGEEEVEDGYCTGEIENPYPDASYSRVCDL